MARFARVVVPGTPHHVTARGNRRQPIFFEDGDKARYVRMLAEEVREAGVAVWAYCLMPNHVHLVLVPRDTEGLARAMGEAHRRYTGFINARTGWTGHLFQGRFASAPMDEEHLVAAVRYVSLNPVRAKLVEHAQDWAWSSVRAHLRGADDGLVSVRPVLDRIERFGDLIDETPGATQLFEARTAALRAAEHTGRPLGARDFVEGLERRLGRRLIPRAPGRPRTACTAHAADLFAPGNPGTGWPFRCGDLAAGAARAAKWSTCPRISSRLVALETIAGKS